MKNKKNKSEEELVYEERYSELPLPDLHKRSLELANDKLKYYPDTWQSQLKQMTEYRVICRIIKQKRHGRV